MEAMDVTLVRTVFNNCQHLHKHQRCLKQMNELYNKCSSDEQLLADFKAELRKCILWTLKEEPKSPFTKHVIEFMAKFLRIFSVHEESTKDEMNTSGDTTIIDEDVAAEVANDCSDQENRQPVSENDESFDELGMESLGSDSFSRSKRQSTGSNLNTSANSTVRSEVLPQSTFSDIIIKEQLIPFLRNVKPQIRLNCCILLRKLLVDIEDVDLNVYNKLKKALRDLTRDKDKAIRAAAALTLQRFQEVDDQHDPVSDALRFHLKYDPDFRVRQSCLISLHATAANIEHYVDATRDVKDIVRKTAFILIADKFDVKNFGIDTRLTILRNGMNERHPAVKKVVEIKLIPNWIKSYSDDIVQLLFGLDIQSDPVLIERTLYLYFDHLNGITKDDSEDTGFHKFLDYFKNRFLSTNNFLTKEELTVENSFLWRIVAKYGKEREISLKIVTNIAEEQMLDSDSQPTEQQNVETVDAIDTVVPDLPHYCNYVKVFVQQLLANDYNDADMLEFQFMLTQLLQMGELIDIGDEAQRQILRQTVENLLLNDQLFQRMHDFVGHLMKIFSKNSDLSSLVNTTLEIIDTINCKSIETECAAMPPPPPPPKPKETEKPENIEEQLRKLELEYAKLSVRVENLKDDLESARKDGNLEEAQKYEELIQSLDARMNEVIDKRLKINAAPVEEQEEPVSSQQSSQMDNRSQKTLTDDPIVLERCLQILSGCLEFGDFKTVHPSILTLMERLVMPSIANIDYFRIRNLAVKILGLICLIGVDLARRNFWIIIQIYQLDNCLEVRETALKCIIDILCAHGFACFDEKASKKKNNKSLSHDKTSIEKSRTDVDMESDAEDIDKTMINDMDNEVLCSDSESEAEDESDCLVNYFTGVMEDNLKSEFESIRLITAQGIAKLFVLGRMFSPQLLSKLLIHWYDPDTSEEMKQFLGAFLPIYANIQMKPNLKGENAFEECFIKCVEMVFDDGLNFVNLDNMINFILELISDDGHKNLAKSVANQILTRMLANGVDDGLSIRYLLRVLAVLRLNEMTLHDIKEYKLLIKKIEKKLNKLRLKPKVVTNRLQTIKLKIDKQLEQIKQKASQTATIDEFGSMSISESLSQSVSTERSQVDDTIFESASPNKD